MGCSSAVVLKDVRTVLVPRSGSLADGQNTPRSAISVLFLNGDFLFQCIAHRPAPDPVTPRLISCPPAVLSLRWHGGCEISLRNTAFPSRKATRGRSKQYPSTCSQGFDRIEGKMHTCTYIHLCQVFKQCKLGCGKGELLTWNRPAPDALMQVQNFCDR
jgi:hypothetical protein